jgi:hypothetical protein
LAEDFAEDGGRFGLTALRVRIGLGGETKFITDKRFSAKAAPTPPRCSC